MQYRLFIALRGPLLIGGRSECLGADLATARDSTGQPVVPASALKGALRIEAERLLRQTGQVVCDAGTGGQLCPPDAPCAVCQLFGGAHGESKLRISDAYPAQEEWHNYFSNRPQSAGPATPSGLGYSVRTGVSLSRSRRVAAEDLLFFLETVSPAFPGQANLPALELVADLMVLRPLSPEEKRLLQGAVLSVRFLGHGKTRGTGWVALRLEEAPPQQVVASQQPQPDHLVEQGVRLVLMPQEYLRAGARGQLGNTLDTLDFLPGSAVRGAVAAWIARQSPQSWDDPVFKEAFLDTQPACFGDAYPSQSGEVWPVPFSARTCKTYPIRPSQEGERHGWRDILLQAAAVEILRQAGWHVVLADRCQECRSELEPLGSGHYYSYDQLREVKVGGPRELHTKTALNRSRGTAAENRLYSYQALEPGFRQPKDKRLRFYSRVTSVTRQLATWLASLHGQSLLVGGARSRGYGRVRVLVESLPRDQTEMRAQQLQTLDEALKALLSPFGLEVNDRLFFTLTLRSDLLLAPAPSLSRLCADMAKNLSLPEDALRMEKAIAATAVRGGYNTAFGLRKDLWSVVLRGSAFVFSIPASYRAQLLAAVPKLTQQGIGFCREEGYGQVSFCDPFHVELMSQKRLLG